MLDKIIIIDFEDSFTYNIASVIFPYEKSVKVLSHEIFFQSYCQKILASNERHAIIYGPGPGRPENHESYFPMIKKLRAQENTYTMGICLGHQILGLIDGLEVNRAEELRHGQTTSVEFQGRVEEVQRYNSLALYEEKREVNIRHFSQGISYQFHPESIGTESNALFFQDLIRFVQ